MMQFNSHFNLGKIMSNGSHQTEVLAFRKGDHFATVVTDGENHQTYEFEKCTRHGSLNMAISYLESMGYEIDVENFNGE